MNVPCWIFAVNAAPAGGGEGLFGPTACTKGAASKDKAMLGRIYIAVVRKEDFRAAFPGNYRISFFIKVCNAAVPAAKIIAHVLVH